MLRVESHLGPTERIIPPHATTLLTLCVAAWVESCYETIT